MQKTKLTKILASIGVILFFVLVVIPPFTRKWYWNHMSQYAPPVPMSKWEKFSSTEGKFSAWFPGAPIEKTQLITNAITTSEEHLFYVNPDIQDGYVITYCDSEIFDEASKSGKAHELLEKSASIVVSKAKGTILSEQTAKFENYPAREFEYKAGGKANYSAKVKYILVGKRVYSLTAVFLTGNPYSEDRANFFNHFQLQE